MKRIQVILASIIATAALTVTVSAQQADGQGKGKEGCKKEECIGQKGKKDCKQKDCAAKKGKSDCAKKCDGTGSKGKKGGKAAE